ncbi:hypothetical protein ACE04B_29660, partial [Rhizobium phaseoli]
SFLYLVVMVAANAKYSINSLLSPVPTSLFLEAENCEEIPSGPNRFRRNALILRLVFQREPGSLPPVLSPPQHQEQ